ncbi:MAG: fasciclin domain-containing protein [bacterium]
MKLLQKIAISTVALGSVATPLSAVAAEAHGYNHAKWNKQDRQCQSIDMKQQRLLDKFNFEKPWHITRFQQLINKDNAKGCVSTQSTFDYLNDFGNFTSLTTALTYTGLDKTLDGPGQFTTFAPTDNAFAKLPAGLVNSLLTDPALKSTLTDILLYHVVAGAQVDAATAGTLTEATTAGGKTVAIKKINGSLFINDSKVVLYDIKTTNGIVHVIDAVLVPSS